MSSSKQAWERVLAVVEADARRAELLLADETSTPDRAGEESPHSTEAGAQPREQVPLPAEWMLPLNAGAEHLPSLDELPDMPEELRERVVVLRDRIDALQAELAQVLRESRNLRTTLAARVPVEAATAPHFVDRRL